MPDVQFAELDPRKIEAAVIAGFEAAARLAGQEDFQLYPGDPRRLFLEAVAAMIVQQNNVIDLTGKGNLLRYAGEETIEDIGWLYGKRGDRLEPSSAVTTLRFTLSTTRATTTVIPANTKVSAGGSLVFATESPLEILPGSLIGTVSARCETEGAVGNGLLPGQLTSLMGRVPFVESVVNITESAGGAGKEGLEPYRLRVRSTPESFSVAGPDGAYEFWAKTANAGIIDVGVWSPAPGEVSVVPLMEGGKLPTQDILDMVFEICNDKTVRPLTDLVHVEKPVIVEYDLELTYWIDKEEAVSAVAISAAVESAIQGYISWQSERLGRDINPSQLVSRIMGAGAKRVRVRKPRFTLIERMQVAHLRDQAVAYGGLEDA